MRFRRLTEVALRNKRVFIRADLNVPQDDAGAITDDTRIRASMPAIEHCLKAGAAVMVTSHLGRPTEGRLEPGDSLAPIAKRLGELLGRDVPLVSDWIDGGFAVAPGEVVLLENCRVNRGEKKNDEALSRKMAALCDVYANDAFGTAHRAHASTAGMAVHFAPDARGVGLLMEKELTALDKVVDDIARPFVGILGGAKILGKIAALEALVERADTLLVGGGMANHFIVALGLGIGKSLLEPEGVPIARKVIDRCKERGVNLVLPSDFLVAPSLADASKAHVVAMNEIPADQAAFDIGPKTIGMFARMTKGAKTIFWNGPMGVFETKPFDAGTRGVAQLMADSGAFTVVGGGESVEAINEAGLGPKISHVSTGGGASLDLISGKTLPGVEVLL